MSCIGEDEAQMTESLASDLVKELLVAELSK
jgi:hypothetical protein